MKIGIYVDNVVVNLNKGFCEFYNSNFGGNLCVEDFEKNYYLKDLMGISEEEELKLWTNYHDSQIFDEMEFIEGCKEAVSFLEEGHELFFITARHLSWKEKTEKLFAEHFGDVNLIFSGDLYGGKSKDEICLENGIGLLIEDHREHSLSYADRGIKILLMDKPWNGGIEHENLIRVNDWKEILREIEKIKEAENG